MREENKTGDQKKSKQTNKFIYSNISMYSEIYSNRNLW